MCYVCISYLEINDEQLLNILTTVIITTEGNVSQKQFAY